MRLQASYQCSQLCKDNAYPQELGSARLLQALATHRKYLWLEAWECLCWARLGRAEGRGKPFPCWTVLGARTCGRGHWSPWNGRNGWVLGVTWVLRNKAGSSAGAASALNRRSLSSHTIKEHPCYALLCGHPCTSVVGS